ncbi:MAG TPA: flagellar basal body rod protein FlgC [Rhizobacter sp.]|nr:flagellar basal body rod protein FlgC [Rhizobacter sp.]
MGFREIASIAGSAMTAQTTRLNTVASNLANANTAASTADTAYKARKPVFATVYGPGESMGGTPVGARVQVLDVVEASEPARKVHEPDNPLADDKGDVYYSNVNSVAEMTDMMAASRAFETNVDVLGRVRSMQQALLRLGDN